MQHADTAVALINSSIIGTIGTLDGSAPQPSTIGRKSLLQYLGGSTAQIRQSWRDDILSTTMEDVLAYAERLQVWEPTLSIGGPKSLLEREPMWNMTLLDAL